MPESRTSRRPLILRILAFLAIFGALAALGYHFEVDQLELADLRAFIARAGAFGPAAYLAIFALGNLIQIPSVLFISAGILIFGAVTGSALALLGSVLGVGLSFWLARTVGGQPLSEVKRPFLKKWLGRAERHPIRTLIVLRSVFLMNPLVDYPLAFSPMRYRDYLVGSALGLAAPVLVVAALLEWFTP